MKKAIEGLKVRLQTQEAPKNAAKIFINKQVFYEVGFQSGQVCIIEAVEVKDGSGATGKPREAIAWPSTENIQKNVVMLSRALKGAALLELGDGIRLSAAGDVPDAETVVVRDVSKDAAPITDPTEKSHWTWLIEGRLSEYVFPGLEVNDVVAAGRPKRSFVIDTVNGRRNNVAKVSSSTKIVWPGESATSEPDFTPGKLEVNGIPGMKSQLDDLNWFFGNFDVEFGPKSHPSPSCGIVIEGSRGTGKSMLLNQIADTRWGKVIRVEDSDKPQAILDYFKNAIDEDKPCMILIDDIKELIGKDKVNRLGAIKAIRLGLEDLARLTEQHRKRPNILVVATCRNHLEDIPESLQTCRGLDRHITLSIPDAPARKEIIRYLEPNFPPEHLEQFIGDLGDRTHAYTGKDLEKLVYRAVEVAARRTNDRSMRQPIVWSDVQKALQEVRPTAMHDITLKPPTIKWTDIGGYQEVKNTLQRVLKRPEPGQRPRRWKPPKGVLLYGPPGCSKTMTAQAMATESGFNFFAVKGGELLNMYVGETERSIRNLFQRAREASPSIIFFDEIDSIAGTRSGGAGGASSSSGGGGVQALTTLLTEMDGFEQLGNVFVLAATNKPDALDPALLRPGRFDELIYVPLPDASAREAIIARKARELQFPESVDVPELARKTDGYSGAEITRLCDRAFMNEDDENDQVQVGGENEPAADAENGEPLVKKATDGMTVLEAAIKSTPKGVTPDMLTHFTLWRMSRSISA
ncbi:P-loop containing nucleoside triphosphate hydrolase protein [Xylariales sp. PMI_506]|nr:P-loop containing nucleoside triphosphate hydrolase protein [Xylariales sp. PMI_506]